MNRFLSSTLLFMALIPTLFLGCASQPIPHNDTQYQNTMGEQIERFQNDLVFAKSQSFHVKDKKDYDEAVKYFDKAKDLARKGDDPEDFRETMHKARYYLDRARDKSLASDE